MGKRREMGAFDGKPGNINDEYLIEPYHLIVNRQELSAVVSSMFEQNPLLIFFVFIMWIGICNNTLNHNAIIHFDC